MATALQPETVLMVAEETSGSLLPYTGGWVPGRGGGVLWAPRPRRHPSS